MLFLFFFIDPVITDIYTYGHTISLHDGCPISPSARIPAMYVLRGCAVMRILWMNIAAFALPEQAYFNPAAAGPLSRGDIAFWTVSFMAVDGKMRALFSMLLDRKSVV